MDEQPVKCFQHCDRTQNIFCFSVPLICPLCGNDVTKTESRIPPYLVSSPFVNSADVPCCVVIKPTIGSFLRDFTNTSNLHVGVTDTKGKVYEFDEDGVTASRDDVAWNQCLPVKLLSNIDQISTDWDSVLYRFAAEPVWTKERYEEMTHNCYDFVIGFLQQTGIQEMVPGLKEKQTFCRDIVVPCTHKAGQYISIYRNILTLGYSLQPAGMS